MRSDPPLDPSGDLARSWLRRELLDPDYYDENPMQRLLGWLDRQISRGVEAASGTPPLQSFAAMLVGLLLVVGLGLLLSRARRTARSATERRAVLTEEVVTAAELRARAEEALSDGRYADAVVEGFRALTVRQVERGHLDPAPGATAHEVARLLADQFPSLAARLSRCAVVFDAVRYGGRPAGREQAIDVIALDDGLVGAR